VGCEHQHHDHHRRAAADAHRAADPRPRGPGPRPAGRTGAGAGGLRGAGGVAPRDALHLDHLRDGDRARHRLPHRREHVRAGIPRHRAPDGLGGHDLEHDVVAALRAVRAAAARRHGAAGAAAAPGRPGRAPDAAAAGSREHAADPGDLRTWA
jgi:hypothetical protein